MGLTEEEKRTLIDIAITTIECKIAGKSIPEFHVDTETLKEKRGAFVTLKKHGHLRGCIGHIEAKKPLYKTVQQMAIAAAFNDPRFPPVKRDEFKNVTIEISVLTPLRKIQDINEIEVGVHGIYIVKGFRSGLLLPQVATEYKWDTMTFLEETCCKAGLHPDAWREKDTVIYIFSADIIGQH